MIGRIFREIKRGFASAVLITILIMTVVNYVRITEVESFTYYGNPVTKLIVKNRMEAQNYQFEGVSIRIHMAQQAIVSNQRVLEKQNDLILSNQLLLEDELRALALLIR